MPKSAWCGTRALDCWCDGMSVAEGQEKIAQAWEDLMRAIGMPTRLSELNVPPEDMPIIAAQTVNNFNANAGARSKAERVAASMDLMQAAW
jgi:alcohol dehydrogenase class IV